MAMGLMQMGSKGPMRDLDYVNPRQKAPSSALPPEVRRKLGLDGGDGPQRSASERQLGTPPEAEHEDIYKGSANANPKVGASGAGTNWHNPNGHAFVRRNSGQPMSQRASRKAQVQNGANFINRGPMGGPPPGANPPSKRPSSLPPLAGARGGSPAGRAPSKEDTPRAAVAAPSRQQPGQHIAKRTRPPLQPTSSLTPAPGSGSDCGSP
eukprot:TRINITY_DN21049_c0_g1_i1.p1 TRINITY_DN21049_c0_g1~~TRINITY_DN21049_c0_g1_i1.p1  ORF type:complete len:209 (-),score=30.33 TRINITY_DN21049_c0_g1_i1:29-655(-)